VESSTHEPDDGVRDSQRSSGDVDPTVRVDEPPDASPTAAAPVGLGRYIVVEQVGAGGMGRVLRAYDPKLRREVALKLLRASMRESQGEARMIREAQAMARLSHPNLVPVYDVEQDGEAVFLAMEYVEGGTLKTWLAEQPRSWRDIVAVFVEAGHGLAAAHAAGIVHRDFKPTNVMIGTDGRVRVMDFGLARGVTVADAESSDDHDPSVAATELTEAGTVIGTPPYMAPEQHGGTDIGPASDQYAFCVAMYEALFGIRPFRGNDLRELVRAKLRGIPDAPAGGAPRVPKWLHAAVVRGLAVEPTARWPSLVALLVALDRGQARARNRRVLMGIGAAGIVTASVVLVHQLDVRRRTAACEQAGAGIAEVWNDDTRSTLRAALIATGVTYAATTADKIMPWLDRQAQAWQHARTEACLDADVRAVWDVDMLDRSLWCLDERRMELDALIRELSQADATAVQRAVAAAAGLARIDGCRDAGFLVRLPSPPLEQRDEVRDIREQLARASALERTGEYTDAAVLAHEARERAEALPWPPLVAVARLREGGLQRQQGEFAAAERILVDAYLDAGRVGAWDVATQAASDLVFVVGHLLARHDDGLAWGRHAEVAAAHGTDPEGLYASGLLNHIAMVHLDKGDFPQARALQEQSVGMLEAALGPDHPDVANVLINLGNVHYATGEFARTQAIDERALAIYEQAFGPDHPDVATTLNNLANAVDELGETTRARELHQRALGIREAALGPDHPDVAQSLLNLANAYYAQGDRAQARKLLERAVAILETSLGPDHPFVATGVDNLATMHFDAGEYGPARELYERALAARERALGPDHPDVAQTLISIAAVHATESDRASALALAERAVAIYDRHEGVQDNEPTARYALAKAIVAAHGDRARARRMAEQARDAWRATGGNPDMLRDVEAWIADLE